MINKILLIIDPQFDFIGGSLKVEGADTAMTNLGSYVIDNRKDYIAVIVTADWHPSTHCSFVENGGKWPTHCVQYSEGASIYKPLLNVFNSYDVDYEVLTKGTNEDREEYSIFKNPSSSEKLKKFILNHNIDEIDICGIAGDVCVLDTIKDGLRELPDIKFNVLTHFCPSIDGGKTLSDFIEKTERCEKV